MVLSLLMSGLNFRMTTPVIFDDKCVSVNPVAFGAHFISSSSHLQYHKLACNCCQQYNFNITIRCSEYVGTCFDPHLVHLQASIEHKYKIHVQLHA